MRSAPSSRRREKQRSITDDDVDESIEAIERKKRKLRRLTVAYGEQSEHIANRERKLTTYADTLGAKGTLLKTKSEKLETKRAAFAHSCSGRQRHFTQQLRDIELRVEPYDRRRSALNRERIATEALIKRLIARVDEMTKRYEYFSGRIKEMEGNDKENALFELQIAIKRTMRDIANASATERQLDGKIEVYSREAPKLRDAVAALKVKAMHIREEMERVFSKRDTHVQEMHSEMHDTSVSLNATKRRALQKKERHSTRLGRLEHLGRRYDNLSEAEDDVNEMLRKNTAALVARQNALKRDRAHLMDMQRSIESIKENVITKHEQEIRTSRQLVEKRTELAKMEAHNRQIRTETAKARAETERLRRRADDDDKQHSEFVLVCREQEREDSEAVVLARRLEAIKEVGIDRKVAELDLSAEKATAQTGIANVSEEVANVRSELEGVAESVKLTEVHMKTQVTEQDDINRKIRDLLTVSTSFYDSGKATLPGIRTSKAIRYDLEARTVARNRRTMQKEHDVAKLMARTKEMRKRIDIKREKATRQIALVDRRERVATEFKETHGLTEEEQIGINSVQDFRRHVIDEVQTWIHAKSDGGKKSILNRWEAKLDHLFGELDNLYLR